MTSKEALERLEKHFHLSCYSFDNNENSDIREYNIIKQDLEHLEELEKVMTILAKKAVNIMRFSLTLDDTNYYYNLGIKKKYQLNKKEYELLKRYFRND